MAELLKMLSEENGVSGNESAVRNIIISEIKDYSDDIRIDTMGNVIALKRGKSDRKTIAVTANMDEAGFIVSGITDKGYLKFKTVGNIDPRKIISKKVVIGDNRIKGVIGMKAIHLQTRSERENVVPVSKLFIDIGAKNKSNAQKYVKLGDYVTFDTEFCTVDLNVKGKALERCAVCTALIRALKEDYPYDVYACFLSQNEVGGRGAKIAAHRINADAVLSISAADTTDMYGCENNNSGAKLGGGVVISYMDKGIIADKNITERMADKAHEARINIQEKTLKPFDGGAGAMQYGAGGKVCMNAVIPCRYAHSPVSLMSLGDIESTVEFVRLFLNKIGEMI